MKKLRVYLDSSCLNRIFDDQTQPRIYLESSSTHLVFNLIEHTALEIVSSEALNYETNNNPYTERKLFVKAVLGLHHLFQETNITILKRAKEIEASGIKGLDAIHIASAEKMNVDYFLTCDDDILKKYRGELSIINPVAFCMKIEKEL